MEFMKALVSKDFGSKLDINLRYRQFEPIRIKEGYWLSIQASYGHYCTPRTTLDNLDEYTHWEMALFNTEDFVQVSDVIPSFPSLVEMELYFDNSIYPYIPTDLVEELYLALRD